MPCSLKTGVVLIVEKNNNNNNTTTMWDKKNNLAHYCREISLPLHHEMNLSLSALTSLRACLVELSNSGFFHTIDGNSIKYLIII